MIAHPALQQALDKTEQSLEGDCKNYADPGVMPIPVRICCSAGVHEPMMSA